MLLCKSDGTFIKADAGHDFMFSIDNNLANALTPGEYMLMVDPIWNECARRDKAFQDVTIDIYCNDEVQIEPIDDRTGMETLVKAFKSIALQTCPKESREFYCTDKPDYAKVYRILDLDSTNIWYGYWFTMNDSPYRLKETFTPSLKGAQVVWPLGNPKDIEIDLGPGESHVILCRRLQASSNFGY